MAEIDKDRGFIKLYRKIDSWEWYSDLKTLALFIHILIHVNHKAATVKGIKVPAGAMITSSIRLSEQLPLSRQEVRTALEHLKQSGEITIKSTNKYIIIKVVKWREYQDKTTNEPTSEQPATNQQLTSEQPATNQQLTTNKNDKNVENVEKSSLTADGKKTDFLKILLPETEVKNPAETESVFRAYMKASPTRLTEAVAEQLQALVDEYGEDKVLTAIDKAVRQGSVRLAYIEAILRDKGGKAKAPERSPYDILMR